MEILKPSPWPTILFVVAVFGYLLYQWLLKKRTNEDDDQVLDTYPDFISQEITGISLRENYFEHFSYFQMLDFDSREKFLDRVNSFILNKKFLARGEMEVTEEMKALIAAAAIQLTFGLEDFTFDYFHTIIVYPETYVSTITGKRHMGEANPRGAIVISWKDFLRGYNIPDDTYNVGLHEMAHALQLESRLGEVNDGGFASRYDKFRLVSESEFEKLRNGEESFLRSYAGTNHEEFFAVCVEYFFEKSEEFKRELPEIYSGLEELLQQKPI